MNIEEKKIVAKLAREGKNKLELMMKFPKKDSKELKEINLFYDVTKEILLLHKKGESEEFLKKVLIKLGYVEKDLEIILGKKELSYKIKQISSIVISLAFVLMILIFFGAIFYNIFSQTEWDFLRKDYTVKGIIFGDDTNFDDLKITSNGVIKNISINGNEYNLTIRCLSKITLNFSKKGFVPLHKKIECEEQTLDLIFASMNDFIKLKTGIVTKVEDKGVNVDINGSDLIVIGTNKLATNPQLSVTAFNPNTPGDMKYFPGELEGIREDGNITAFESYGFAKIIAEDENGNSLDFKEGTRAKIIFPIDEAQLKNAPEEMPLWYFDEIKGAWIEEGFAKKVCERNACIYLGEINRVRSSWNADHPVPTYSKDVNDWNAVGDKKCPEDKPNQIFGFYFGKEDYGEGGKNKEYICCPEDTTKSTAVFVGGKPTQCSCSKDNPKRFFKSETATTICCHEDSKAFMGSEKNAKDFFKCGKCSYGPIDSPNSLVCEENCTICRGENIVSLKQGVFENCEESIVKDCSKEGKICVEHVSNYLGDPTANCECPDSLTFVTVTNDFHLYITDGYDYLQRPFNIGGFTSQNTFFTLSNANEVLEKVTRFCKSKCPNQVRLILVNHGSPAGGTQIFGNGFTGFSIRELNIVNQIVNAGLYDFSCVKEVVWSGCYVGNDLLGRMFLEASANIFGAVSYGASCSVNRHLGSGQDRIGWGNLVTVKPNGSSKKLQTIFYSTSNNLFFPGITNEAYQTEVLNGELGEVKVYINSKDSSRNKIAEIKDVDFECFKKTIKSETFTINSTTQSVLMDNLKIEFPLGSVQNGELVKLKINKLKVDCNDFEKEYWGESYYLDSSALTDLRNSLDYNLISKESYEKAKTLYDNNWICMEDSDCFGPCPMGDLNCSYGCTANHECKIISSDFNLKYVPSTSVVEDESESEEVFDSKLINPNNSYAFMTIGQSITKRNVKFEDIGKNINFTYSGSVAPRISFTINNVPSTPQNFSSIPSRGAIFTGYSLNNCNLWNGYPTELADCISGYDSIYGLSWDEALKFLNELDVSGKDKGIIGTKLAQYYNEIDFCYPSIKGDYYAGLACIKLVDKEKEIDSNKNIFGILGENLGDYELSFVLRNLSEYYWDINYCYPIPTDSQREACIGRFPKEPEVVEPVDLCGNGLIDGREKCDGTNFGELSCEDYGFNRGELFCVNCQINKSGCYNYYEPTDPKDFEPTEPIEPIINPICGNGVVEGNEDCDQTQFDGLTCVDYGFNSGELICENCRVNSNNCENIIQQTCGNGVVEGNEECEGTNFKGKTCAQYGFNSGNLVCNNCKISATQCKNEVAPPPEIDPLEVFNCPFNTSYSSPIKDKFNEAFWVKVIHNSKVFAYKVPYKKSECVGETVLEEDDEGKLIPCITEVVGDDGCIIEKREVGSINHEKNYYIDVGKHENVYKQNPVDFVGEDGNVFFLIQNQGKYEFIKFNPNDAEQKETIQIYDSNDYDNKIIPGIKRAMASGDVIWVVLNGALHNVYVDGTGSSYDRGTKCYNVPYRLSSYSNEGTAGFGTNSGGMSYNYGEIFKSFDYLGNELGTVHNKVFCYSTYDSTPFEAGTWSTGQMSGFDFDPTKWTYAGDGYGNILSRTNEHIYEYSTDSNDIDYPSYIK